MTFEPHKKQSRMTAFFHKQPGEQGEAAINDTQPASRTQVRQEYQAVLARIESASQDDPWNVEEPLDNKKQSCERHGDLSKLVSRTGGPTIQPRIIKMNKRNNLDSAIVKMKEKCSLEQQKKQLQNVVVAAATKVNNGITEPRIKVATIRSDTSVSAKEFEKRLMERIKAKSRSSKK
ncbi:hypothetical protein BDB00DRAFT_871781 [Zychaea mexicana]|uniref:uncharacterized protein n=1 Tax=Zychaea mexicana TaxID=64656 RepID=UPI0022FF2BA4|nr:uncharacterized protein BDB00DRAFT_871781 [Zychaea mexicana]KAI9494022.1 hypothetical protein BDB00DRAFT_871781 [Zychaea mexicana]